MLLLSDRCCCCCCCCSLKQLRLKQNQHSASAPSACHQHGRQVIFQSLAWRRADHICLLLLRGQSPATDSNRIESYAKRKDSTLILYGSSRRRLGRLNVLQIAQAQPASVRFSDPGIASSLAPFPGRVRCVCANVCFSVTVCYAGWVKTNKECIGKYWPTMGGIHPPKEARATRHLHPWLSWRSLRYSICLFLPRLWLKFEIRQWQWHFTITLHIFIY